MNKKQRQENRKRLPRQNDTKTKERNKERNKTRQNLTEQKHNSTKLTKRTDFCFLRERPSVHGRSRARVHLQLRGTRICISMYVYTDAFTERRWLLQHGWGTADALVNALDWHLDSQGQAYPRSEVMLVGPERVGS